MSLPINNYELIICNNNLDYLLAKNQEANAVSLFLIMFVVLSNAILYYLSNKIISNYLTQIYYYKILVNDLNNRYDLELELDSPNIKDCVIEYQTRPEVEADSEESEEEEEETTNKRTLRSNSLTIKGNGWKLD
tara:strand:- start:73 stop:474 length:402 start_codon:yes stop_codon:yes gene_type:complete